MVAAGNPPTASQILGYFAIDYAEAASSATSRRSPRKKAGTRSFRRRCRSSPRPTASGTPSRQHPLRQLGLDQQGRDGQDRRNRAEDFDDFIALLDKAKAAGVIPLALGGQPWQEATMFDSVVMSTGGPDFLQEGVRRHGRIRLEVGHDEEGVRQPRQAEGLYRPEFAGRDWNLATAMVIKGDALVQVMGDWAKGEFKAANKEAGKDSSATASPARTVR